MGLLDKLWDDSIAGPTPETGLSKLRKYDSFPATKSRPINIDPFPISRSITILNKHNKNSNIRNVSADTGSVPSSPAGSSSPSSPLSPLTFRRDLKGLMRRDSTSVESSEHTEPRSPTVYDWVMISALDR